MESILEKKETVLILVPMTSRPLLVKKFYLVMTLLAVPLVIWFPPAKTRLKGLDKSSLLCGC
jgi:hypothetical protein